MKRMPFFQQQEGQNKNVSDNFIFLFSEFASILNFGHSELNHKFRMRNLRILIRILRFQTNSFRYKLFV